ncbi:SPOR domain-containing protein [Sphingomonas sp. RS6]
MEPVHEMKPLGIIAVSAALALGSPALAQDSPVKRGVDAYARGDYQAAVALWQPAAEKGDADAQFNLGQAYKLGRGVKADLGEAETWFGLAARQAHEQAETNYGLLLFENGKQAQAVPWLDRAATRGEPRAQYVLGVMLFNGDGVTKNWIRAYALMTRSSASGLNAATQTLAQMDQFIPAEDREAGLTLARSYEQAASTVVHAPAKGASPARPRPTTASPAPKPAPATPDGSWRVQLGAFAVASNADRLWTQVRGRFPGLRSYQVKSGRLTKLLVGPFPSRAKAVEACREISPCVAVKE